MCGACRQRKLLAGLARPQSFVVSGSGIACGFTPYPTRLRALDVSRLPSKLIRSPHNFVRSLCGYIKIIQGV